MTVFLRQPHMPKSLRIFFLLLLFLVQLKTFAVETLTYDMYLWGDKIGRMTISRTEENGTEVYVLDSKAKAKVLWVVRDNTAHMETVFKNGKWFPVTREKSRTAW